MPPAFYNALSGCCGAAEGCIVEGWGACVPPLSSTLLFQLYFCMALCMNFCMVARFGGQSGSAVLFPSAGGAGLGTLAALGGDGMLVFLVEFFGHSIFADNEFGALALRRLRWARPPQAVTDELFNVAICLNFCMVARLGGQLGSAVLFPSAGGAGLGTLASLGGDGMLVFLVEFFCHAIFSDQEFGALALR